MPNNDGDFLPSGPQYVASPEFRFKPSPEAKAAGMDKAGKLVPITRGAWEGADEEAEPMYGPGDEEPGEPGVMVLAAVLLLGLIGFGLGVATGFLVFWSIWGK